MQQDANMAATYALKRALRKSVQKQLNALTSDEISRQSSEVLRLIQESGALDNVRAVSCYLSMPKGELSTDGLVGYILERGIPLFVPFIPHTRSNSFPSSTHPSPPSPQDDMHLLRLYSVKDLEACDRDKWGIPDIGRSGLVGLDGREVVRENALSPTSPELDLILLPGVAFDTSTSFGRLGHGKGYYDRYIRRYREEIGTRGGGGYGTKLGGVRGPVLMALALNEQILPPGETVPTTESDEPMDILVYPGGILRRPSSSSAEFVGQSTSSSSSKNHDGGESVLKSESEDEESISRSTFDAAADWLSTAPAAASLPNDIKLEIYGIYKLLTVGSEPDGPAPGWLSMPAVRAKYNAWVAQGRKYGSEKPAAAEVRYVEIASSIGFQASGSPESGGNSKGGLGGVSVSMIKLVRSKDGASAAGAGFHPLHDAVQAGDVKRCRRVLAERPTMVNTKDEFGMTPLHIAADRGNKDIVGSLLEAGADKFIHDDDGFTARENAEAAEHADIAAML